MSEREKTGLEFLASGGIRQNRMFDNTDDLENDMEYALQAILAHCTMLENRIAKLEATKMSTPMYDLPEHVWIPVTVDGNGPAYDDEFDHWECWCGDVGCEKSEYPKPANKSEETVNPLPREALRDALWRVIDEGMVDRGKYVSEWPEDEAEAYREFGWDEGRAAARAIQVAKTVDAVLSLLPDDDWNDYA